MKSDFLTKNMITRNIILTIAASCVFSCSMFSNTYPGSTSSPERDFISAFGDNSSKLYDWKRDYDLCSDGVRHVIGKMELEGVVFEFDFAIDEQNEVLLVDVTEDGAEYFTGLYKVDDHRVINKVLEVDKVLERL